MLNTFILSIGLFATSPTDSANKPVSVHPIHHELENIVNHPFLEGANVSLHVLDFEKDKVLYSHNPDESLIPASTIKLFTTAAALFYLGSEYRFMTRIFGSPPNENTIESDIYLQSDGDPWLVPERIWYLANRLRYLGVREIKGDIYVDNSYFSGPMHASGVEQDLTSNAYMSPAGAVSVGFNAVHVHIRPATKLNEPATIEIEPTSSYLNIQGEILTQDSESTNLKVDIVPTGDKATVVVSGKLNVADGPLGYWRRIPHSALHAGAVLKDLLTQTGVRVHGNVKVGHRPEAVPILVEMESPRLAELITKVNQYSNNFMASQLARAVGAIRYGIPGTWDKGKKSIHDFLTKEVGITTTFSIENASGLHDVNRVSTRQVTRLLQFMLKKPELKTEYLASLSIAGQNGTLSTRMEEGRANKRLRGKTGTLKIASALSGIVFDHKNRPFLFSFLVNNYRRSIQDIWQVQDNLGNVLATQEPDKEKPSSPLGIRSKEP